MGGRGRNPDSGRGLSVVPASSGRYTLVSASYFLRLVFCVLLTPLVFEASKLTANLRKSQ